MLKINLHWGKKIYENTYCGSRNVEEYCKKNLLLNIDIKGVCESISEEIMVCLIDRLYNEVPLTLTDSDELLLSYHTNNASSTYDAATRTYTDTICIPKDYDNLEMQKKAVMSFIRNITKELKCEYASYSREAANMHYACEVAF